MGQNMIKQATMVVLAALVLGGCAASGSNVHLEANNSPAECAHQMAMGKVPVAQQHDFVRHCSAGYEAAHANDDGTFTLPPPKKAQDGQ